MDWRARAALAAFCGLLLGVSLSRADDDTPPARDFIPGPAWKESQVALPEPPRDSDLVLVTPASPRSPFEVLLDARALSVGPDRVTRYTVVLRSSAGAQNVLYEGIRCATGEYRTYAVGSLVGFDTLQESHWERIRAGVGYPFRRALYRDYLCDRSASPRQPARVLGDLRAGFNDHEY
jgi:hypothetical protein